MSTVKIDSYVPTTLQKILLDGTLAGTFFIMMHDVKLLQKGRAAASVAVEGVYCSLPLIFDRG